MHLVNFINLEEDDKDLIVSFALSDGEQDIKSLILLRTLVYEEFLDESERGVHVSFEGTTSDDEQPIILKELMFEPNVIHINTERHSFHLDLSKIEESEMQEMKELLGKQNYDNSFSIQGI